MRLRLAELGARQSGLGGLAGSARHPGRLASSAQTLCRSQARRRTWEPRGQRGVHVRATGSANPHVPFFLDRCMRMRRPTLHRRTGEMGGYVCVNEVSICRTRTHLCLPLSLARQSESAGGGNHHAAINYATSSTTAIPVALTGDPCTAGSRVSR